MNLFWQYWKPSRYRKLLGFAIKFDKGRQTTGKKRHSSICWRAIRVNALRRRSRLICVFRIARFGMRDDRWNFLPLRYVKISLFLRGHLSAHDLLKDSLNGWPNRWPSSIRRRGSGSMSHIKSPIPDLPLSSHLP
jgi:hypothetical protein